MTVAMADKLVTSVFTTLVPDTTSIKMHIIKSMFVTGPSKILFARVRMFTVRTFHT